MERSHETYSEDEVRDVEASQVGAFMATIAFARLHKIWASRCDGLRDRLLRGTGDTYNDVTANRAKLSAYEEVLRDFRRLKGDETQ